MRKWPLLFRKTRLGLSDLGDIGEEGSGLDFLGRHTLPLETLKTLEILETLETLETLEDEEAVYTL